MATAPGRFFFSEAFEGDGRAFFRRVEELGLEGIVSKRKHSLYRSGPSRDWLKTRAYVVGAFEVIGVERGSAGSASALLARRDGGGLHCVGNAAITLRARERELFWRFVSQHQAAGSPVRGLERQAVIWLKPGLSVTAKYIRGSEAGLRHAIVNGLRLREPV
jgi:ATP-dependent DNA ligase